MNEQNTNNQHPEAQEKEQTVESAGSSAVDAARQEAALWKEKYARLAADFQNFQRRLEKDQASLKRLIQSNLLLDFLNIVDNLDRASDSYGASAPEDWRVGIDLIRKDITKMLEKYQVRKMAITDQFDPVFHEAIASVPADEKHVSGSVVTVVQAGYMMGDQVLRPAKVTIAQ